MNHFDTLSAKNAESSPFVTYFQHVECEKCLRICPFGLSVDASQGNTNSYFQVMSAVSPRDLTTRYSRPNKWVFGSQGPAKARFCSCSTVVPVHQQSAVDVSSPIRTETVNRRPYASEGEAPGWVQRAVLAVAASQILDRECPRTA